MEFNDWACDGEVVIPFTREDTSPLDVVESDFFDVSCFGCRG